MPTNDLQDSVEAICNWLGADPVDFAEGGREAVIRLLKEIEPDMRRRNLVSDFEHTLDLVKAMKPGSRPSPETLHRAYGAAYGMKISVGATATGEAMSVDQLNVSNAE